jgi:MatE
MRVSFLVLGGVQICWLLAPTATESLSLRSTSSSLSKKFSQWRPSVHPKPPLKTTINFPSPLYVSDNSRTLERPHLTERFVSIFASKTKEEDGGDEAAAVAAQAQKSLAAAANTDATDVDAAGSSLTSSTAAGFSSGDGLLPSYRSLIVFTVTTILIWLSEPLLSLVDTAIVGLTAASGTSSVVQIAALGPATTLFDSAIYMTYFLAIATTNQLAPALARREWKILRTSTSHIMGLASLFGCLVTAVVFGWGHTLIGHMVGPTITDLTIVPLATNYARIRAAVAPFAVIGFVAQSVSLQGDDDEMSLWRRGGTLAGECVVVVVWQLIDRRGPSRYKCSPGVVGSLSATVLPDNP